MSEELRKAIDDLGRAFEEFKQANDQRINELARGKDDPVLSEKVERLSAAVGEFQDIKSRLDEIETALARPGGMAGAPSGRPEQEAHARAFEEFFRRGVDDGLCDLEVRAGLTTQSDPDGGYLVPAEWDQEIGRVLASMGAMRSLARVVTPDAAEFKRVVNTGGTTSGWVGETETRSETETPRLSLLTFPAMELYASPLITQSLLDDSGLDLAAWLADEVAIEFSEQEGDAFITGSGKKKPRGILSYPTVANSSYAWGKIGYVPSGANGDFASSDPADALFDLQHALKRGYRANAVWLMNDLTLARVRKLKDANGEYLWRPGLAEGQPETLLGKPVATDDFMPDIAADSLAIAFGDFRRGYVIVDRSGTRVLRDPYTSKPYVLFYTTKRIGGGVQNFEAIKVMKFAAS